VLIEAIVMVVLAKAGAPGMIADYDAETSRAALPGLCEVSRKCVRFAAFTGLNSAGAGVRGSWHTGHATPTGIILFCIFVVI
jgi:hypothetical protein